MEEIKGVTELCEIAMKYGADKCPQLNHMYTPFYYEYFGPIRQTVKKVFEFGVGNHRIKTVIPHYQMGASLRMWRDFFPNAQVYGADIARGSVFKDERLTTYRCNENSKEEIEELIKIIGSDIDIVIDDASHHIEQQLNLVRYLMPLLWKNVTYVVEDCRRTRVICKSFPEYDCFVPKLLPNIRPKASDGLVVLTYKK